MGRRVEKKELKNTFSQFLKVKRKEKKMLLTKIIPPRATEIKNAVTCFNNFIEEPHTNIADARCSYTEAVDAASLQLLLV